MTRLFAIPDPLCFMAGYCRTCNPDVTIPSFLSKYELLLKFDLSASNSVKLNEQVMEDGSSFNLFLIIDLLSVVVKDDSARFDSV